MKRLFPPHVRAVVEALTSIFKDGYYADKVIQRTLKADPRRGAKDRAFIAEHTYEMVRWWRLLWYLSGSEEKINDKKLYQLFGTYWIWKDNELPDWVEFKGVESDAIYERLKTAKEELKIIESIPDWMDELGRGELGDEKWETEVTAMNREADIFVRVNTLRTNHKEIAEEFNKSEVQFEKLEDAPSALHITKRQNLFSLPVFKKGWFEMQDIGSQQIVPFLQVEPGMRVIDACAGAGGKALHLSALMQNKGRIISMDIEGHKLVELKRRAKRAGSSIIETRVIENSKTIKRLKNSADRLLLDVPCSGLGVLKRNPDAKWKLKKEFIDNILETQQHIISSYSQMLKPGGLMVYATCSVLPSENENQVQKFLENNTDFTLVEDKHTWPSEDLHDGFYMALIKKEG